MTKSEAREIAVRFLFASAADIDELLSRDTFERFAQEDPLFCEFPSETREAYIRRVYTLTKDNIEAIDNLIEQNLRGWTIGRLSKTTLSVLRCAVCEICYMPEIPNGAAINEAVELAKKYDGEENAQFINGVLGTIARNSSLTDEQ